MGEYPNNIYSPRTKNNKEGVVYDESVDTTLFAEDVVKDDNEIVAIETELGTNPKATSASLKERLKGIRSLADAVADVLVVKGGNVGIGTTTPKAKLHVEGKIIGGLAIRDKARNLRASTTAVNTMEVSADEIILQDDNGYGIQIKNVYEVLDIAQSGVNGLDTGLEASNTWYYMWIIYNPVTDDIAGLLSLKYQDSDPPTMPAGYTYKALIGAIRNDSSSNFITIYQANNRVVRTNFTALNLGTQTSYTEVDISAAVPATAQLVAGSINIDAIGFSGTIKIASDITGLGELQAYIFTAEIVDNPELGTPYSLFLSETQKMYYKITTGETGAYIRISRWEY